MSTSKKGWFNLAYKRLNSETPKFFKKIFIFSASFSGLAVALMALKDANMVSVNMHSFIDKYASYCAIIGAVGAFMSRLPTNDTELSKR